MAIEVIQKDSKIYIAIENAIDKIFDEEIPLTDPTETMDYFMKSVNLDLVESLKE